MLYYRYIFNPSIPVINMFTRIIKIKKNGKNYKYLRLVENVWQDGKTKQRVVANLGNVDTLNTTKIDSAILSLLRFSSGYFKDIRSLKTKTVQHLGELLAGEKTWQILGMNNILKRHLNSSHLSGDAPLLVKTMALSRLVEPTSKLALSENYHQLALSDLADKSFACQHFYRAMDELIPRKEAVEIDLHEREKDLFSLNLNLVFYDLTSSYFEGNHCRLGKHGYSRDHRRDLEQVVIGLLVTDEGLPIAHQVYTGNRKDSTTLTDQISSLKKTFGIKKCVLVVDRGMVTEDNLVELTGEGYQYIVALRKRKQSLFQPILSDLSNRLQPIEGQKSLSGFETRLQEFGADRVVICYNPDKAEVEARHRKDRLDKAETRIKEIQGLFLSGKRKDREKLLQQAARYLERRKLTRFWSLRTDKESGIDFSLNRDKVDFEAQLDGLFILRTNRTDLTLEEVVSAYKTLSRVESAFKELKDFIDLRPMYHWSEDRVRAHIFICVLAYLVEVCIDIQLKRAGLEMTARRALQHLGEIKLVKQEIDGLQLCTYSQPSPESRKIINALELHLPKEKLFVK
jgi:transposase